MSLRSFPIALLLAALAASTGSGSQAPAPPATSLTLVTAAGRRALATVMVGDREMLSLDDLAATFQLTVREDALAGGLTVTYKGRAIVLTPDQAVASVNGRLVSLPSTVVRSGRRWLVPLEFINRALALVFDSRLELRRASRLVIVGDLRVPRVVARQELVGSQAHVTFEIAPRAATTVVLEPRRLVVRFEADALDATLPPGGTPGLVESMHVVDPGTAIALELGPRFASYRSSTVPLDGGQVRLVIDVAPAAEPAPAAPAPVPPAPVPPAPSTPPSAAAPPPFPLAAPPDVRTVVLDPGHGGDEEGARGPGGTLEKDLNLALARRLKTLLESRLGLRVLLTRDGDATVPLDQRAAMANNNKADLFLSLHANASLVASVAGAQVYYLSTDDATDPTRLSAGGGAETLPTLGGGSREIDVILWEMAQMRHLSESAVFASMIQEALAGRVPMNARPVQQAPFRVLVGANMPAVLVEVAFLTNIEQERQLQSSEFQGQIVQALFDAIVRYRDRVEHGAPSDRTAPAAAGQPGLAPGS